MSRLQKVPVGIRCERTLNKLQIVTAETQEILTRGSAPRITLGRVEVHLYDKPNVLLTDRSLTYVADD